MGAMECQTKWLGESAGGLAFSAQVRQHSFIMDAGQSSGGKDQGPSPKEVLLASICACSGMDVASILKKMRGVVESCEVNAKTETTSSYPSIFKEVLVEYKIKGSEISEEQALKAVRLSMTKYCGVSAMVVDASPISYQVHLNGKWIGDGKAHFEEVAE
ncbi:OsmC family protein [Bdellovibrio sp. HCB2-146]|uniref:OsmC family protein n=1 Tax=Bdellovibrio sp. HCB2-146 TaxID=3394362 RepID=UPI0039BC5451